MSFFGLIGENFLKNEKIGYFFQKTQPALDERNIEKNQLFHTFYGMIDNINYESHENVRIFGESKIVFETTNFLEIKELEIMLPAGSFEIGKRPSKVHGSTSHKDVFYLVA